MMAAIADRTAETLALAREIATALFWSLEIEEPETNRLDFGNVPVQELINIVTVLRVQRLGYLAAITGLDPGSGAEHIEVLYHFCAGQAVITLRVPVPRSTPVVPTLSTIIPVAEAFERELQEMFGLTVSGLSCPEHLYLPDEWPGEVYPMRKDFDPAMVQTNGEGLP